MLGQFDFNVIERSFGYLFKEGMTFTLTLTGLAAENGLPAERAALAMLAEAIDQFRDKAENWLDSHRLMLSAQQALAAAAVPGAR